jgi:hypothetical protein
MRLREGLGASDGARSSASVTRSPLEHHSRARKPSDASVSSPSGDRGHQRVPGSHLGSTGATVGGLAAEDDAIAEHLLVHIACRYPRTPHLLRAGFPSRARPPHRHHATNCACLLRRRGYGQTDARRPCGSWRSALDPVVLASPEAHGKGTDRPGCFCQSAPATDCSGRTRSGKVHLA